MPGAVVARRHETRTMTQTRSKPKAVASSRGAARPAREPSGTQVVAAPTGKKKHWSEMFSNMACTVAHWTGKPIAFLIAATLVIVWAATGPLFGYSDTWQLVINTSTTIVTFLMVFLIQNTQNRDTMALQLKLSELILAVSDAENRFAAPKTCRTRSLSSCIKSCTGALKKRAARSTAAAPRARKKRVERVRLLRQPDRRRERHQHATRTAPIGTNADRAMPVRSQASPLSTGVITAQE